MIEIDAKAKRLVIRDNVLRAGEDGIALRLEGTENWTWTIANNHIERELEERDYSSER